MTKQWTDYLPIDKKGGKGSGNWGHASVPGQYGGSAPSDAPRGKYRYTPHKRKRTRRGKTWEQIRGRVKKGTLSEPEKKLQKVAKEHSEAKRETTDLTSQIAALKKKLNNPDLTPAQREKLRAQLRVLQRSVEKSTVSQEEARARYRELAGAAGAAAGSGGGGAEAGGGGGGGAGKEPKKSDAQIELEERRAQKQADKEDLEKQLDSFRERLNDPDITDEERQELEDSIKSVNAKITNVDNNLRWLDDKLSEFDKENGESKRDQRKRAAAQRSGKRSRRARRMSRAERRERGIDERGRKIEPRPGTPAPQTSRRVGVNRPSDVRDSNGRRGGI